MINRTGRMAALFMVCGVVSGCSTVGLDDMFASDKQTLDESQIVANPTLAVPPDLSLRPPAEGAGAPRQPVASQQPVTTAPPNYGAPEPEPVQQQAVQQPTYPTPQPVPSQQAATTPQTAATPQTATAPATDPNDPYAKWGVSRYRADGTKKSQAEINEEMRQVKLKQKQAENPNYGTIWNLGNVWSDN